MAVKRVFYFGGGKAEGNGAMKDVLGGKGAGLAEMTSLGVPVPPGFTISAEVCNLYYRNRGKLPQDVKAEIAGNLAKLERAIGKKLGDPKNPLLVSVRSGAKFSMPGMMDTVLNLGLNDKTVEGLSRKSRNPRFAYDSYRRFLMMFSDVVLDLPKSDFEHIFAVKKQERGAADDVDLTAEDLISVCGKFKALVKERLKREFPQDPRIQLELARDAVFRSWNNDRAKYYRKANGIPDDIGTAVNVQAMVFGNMGDECATGVGFTRNPATGAREFYGEYLVNAQGEDVVAGIRTPRQIRDMKKDLPKVFDQLMRITAKLEKHYKDVQDFEFTIESNTLFMLQTRNAKRTAAAAVKIMLPPDEYYAGVLVRAALHFFDPGIFEVSVVLLLLATLGGYAVVFLALSRLAPERAYLHAAVMVMAALAIYWLWFDHTIHASSRYYLRTALVIVTPVFGALAALGAMDQDGRLALRFPRLQRAMTTARNRAARPLAAAFVLVTLVHVIETGKFVAAWRDYRAAVAALATGDASDPALGDPRFVSSARIGSDLNRLSWFSTTPYLSAIVADFRPNRLVIDPAGNYFWLSCATATANSKANRAAPAEARDLVRIYSCLHR